MLKVLKLIAESFIFALKSVFVNRLRTSLSLLGITIGIFAIISVFTIVDSLEMNIRESINSMGSNVIYIEKWPWTSEEGQDYPWWKYVNRPVPNIKEYEELEARLKNAEAVSFVISPKTSIQYHDNQVDNATITGVTEGFEEIRNFDIQSGRYFSPFELTAGRNFTVIGHNVAKQLFPSMDPLGKTIEVRHSKLKVIGILEREGKTNFGDSMDDAIIVPVNFIRNVVNIRNESMHPAIWVKAEPGIELVALTDEIRMSLRSIRRLKPNAEDNFALNQISMINNQLEKFFSTLNIAGWFIGIFSLLVGGFGIANIMFVSVKERTTIIGVEKALGARRYFILLQFVFESVLLALSGGIIGLMLIFGGTFMINVSSDFTITLTLGNIIMGLVISSLIGLIAGLAPAYTAARMDPVTAINTSF
ncbi:MAG TPA: ABC transporter permease [Bacteroidales bacterium]|nr:ABC transporter permease [Bacteroidales bacterium]